MVPRVDILGVQVSALTMDAALETVAGWIARREQHWVCVTTVHGIMECRQEPSLRRIHNQAGLPKSASEQLFESYVVIVKSTLANGEDVMISRFGKFCVNSINRDTDCRNF